MRRGEREKKEKVEEKNKHKREKITFKFYNFRLISLIVTMWYVYYCGATYPCIQRPTHTQTRMPPR